jgi:hypothetical protein
MIALKNFKNLSAAQSVNLGTYKKQLLHTWVHLHGSRGFSYHSKPRKMVYCMDVDLSWDLMDAT